jgi:hypothetical protein
MDKLSPRQFSGIVLVIGAVLIAGIGGGFTQRQLVWLVVMGVAGVVAVLYGGAAGGASRETLERLRTAVRRIGEGRAPDAPPGTADDVRRVYEALGGFPNHTAILAAGAGTTAG